MDRVSMEAMRAAMGATAAPFTRETTTMAP